MKVPVGSKEGMGGTAEGEGTRGSTDGEEIVKKLEDTLGSTMGGDSHSLISNLKPQKLLQLLDVSNGGVPYTGGKSHMYHAVQLQMNKKFWNV